MPLPFGWSAEYRLGRSPRLTGIGAEDNGVLWRIEIEAHDGLQFFRELRIITDLERAHQVWLQAMFMPDPPHALFANSTGLCHGASTPVGCVVWFRLRGFADHVLDLGRHNRGRSARPRT
jgi:hypothetical protein